MAIKMVQAKLEPSFSCGISVADGGQHPSLTPNGPGRCSCEDLSGPMFDSATQSSLSRHRYFCILEAMLAVMDQSGICFPPIALTLMREEESCRIPRQSKSDKSMTRVMPPLDVFRAREPVSW